MATLEGEGTGEEGRGEERRGHGKRRGKEGERKEGERKERGKGDENMVKEEGMRGLPRRGGIERGGGEVAGVDNDHFPLATFSFPRLRVLYQPGDDAERFSYSHHGKTPRQYLTPGRLLHLAGTDR